MIRISCDRAGCAEAHIEDSPQLVSWFMVQTMDPADDSAQHFCSKDHLLLGLSGFEVAEGVGKEEVE